MKFWRNMFSLSFYRIVSGKMFLQEMLSLCVAFIINSIMLAMLYCLSGIAQAQDRTIDGTRHLATEINQIINSVGYSAAVGIHIKSMKYGDTLYTKNSQQLFTPASILKILTAEAALLYLGPYYTFTTTLFTDAISTNHGVVNGNIYLVHSGDPSLTYEDLNDLMVTLKSQQIRGILGNVYIDNTAYDQVNVGPGWGWDDVSKCYAAPINASIINHNCLSFKIAAAKLAGRLANIIQSPHYFYGAIQNSVITKKYHKHSCYLQLTTINNAIAISGCMPTGKNVWGVNTVIGNIMQYNRALIRSLFKRYNIYMSGTVLAGPAPAMPSKRLATIALHQSKALHVLVNEMLKSSDNIIAGSLFKKMGEFYTKQPGSWANGSEAVKYILAKKASVDSSQMRVLDGSGISRNNQIKPAQLMQVLDFAYHDEATSSDFIAALPIAGVDGTLKHRLYNVARKVRAKTGTMSGVVSLAGYALSQDKEVLAFVIIVNGHNGSGWKYREIEDKIVTALTHYHRM